MCYACTQFWLNVMCAWTMQPMYNVYAQMLFSVLFSAAPIVIYGVTERDIDASVLLTHPHLYAQGSSALDVLAAARVTTLMFFCCAGLQNTLFTIPSFVSWVFSALMQSAVCACLPSSLRSDSCNHLAGTFFAYYGCMGPTENEGRYCS